MLTSHQVGLQHLKLYQTLRACSKDSPENASLLSDSSDKHQLEIKDGARGQTSSKRRTREVKDQDGKKPKKAPGFLTGLLLIKFWPAGGLDQSKHKRWWIISRNKRPEGPQRVPATWLVWEVDIMLPWSEGEVGKWRQWVEMEWNLLEFCDGSLNRRQSSKEACLGCL